MEGARCLQDPTLWGAGGSGRQGPSAGVTALANLLQIQRHDDYLVMLKAIRILVQERLTQDAVAKANQTKEVRVFLRF